MEQARAVVVDSEAAGRLAIRAMPVRVPLPSEALVRVKAISLNLGEVRRALTIAEPGWRPGWDLAGVVESRRPPTVRSLRRVRALSALCPLVRGPRQSRCRQMRWANCRTTSPSRKLQLCRSQVSPHSMRSSRTARPWADACWSPERRVAWVIWRSRLAGQAGVFVVAAVRRPEREKHARVAGAHEVVIGEELSAASKFGPYDLIIESVGSASLAAALKMLAPGGMCVLLGVSSASEVTFDASTFMRTGGASLYGFILFHELPQRPAAQGLGRLVAMVASGRLYPQIELEAPYEEIAEVANKLYSRGIAGKAVLHL